MTPAELLSDAFGRIHQSASTVLDGLTEEQLTARPGADANTIAWLVWHLARVEDDHVAEVAGHEQLWTADGYSARFGLPFDDTAIGYGQTTEEVGQVRAPAELLDAYQLAVHARTLGYLSSLNSDDLDRIVDERWDPPVTLGARLVSVLNDATQHVGQASYVRGLVTR
jgi:uncharacterized damage-inducible protein DinB